MGTVVLSYPQRKATFLRLVSFSCNREELLYMPQTSSSWLKVLGPLEMSELKSPFRKALSKHAFQDNFLGSLWVFWYREESWEIYSFFQSTIVLCWVSAEHPVKQIQRAVSVHCKQAEPKTDDGFVFQDYDAQQVLEKQSGIFCLPNTFFDGVSLFRSKTCPEQTSLYRPCLYLLSRHTRDFRVFSFVVFSTCLLRSK